MWRRLCVVYAIAQSQSHETLILICRLYNGSARLLVYLDLGYTLLMELCKCAWFEKKKKKEAINVNFGTAVKSGVWWVKGKNVHTAAASTSTWLNMMYSAKRRWSETQNQVDSSLSPLSVVYSHDGVLEHFPDN